MTDWRWKIHCGNARALLPEIRPDFIVTDCPKIELPWLIGYAEKNECIVIDAYSLLWLVNRGVDAEKAPEPYGRLIRAWPDQPVVCDPYMGVGSIGIAALLEGRDYIGIEIDERIFHRAERRLLEFQNATAGQNRAGLPGDSQQARQA